MTPSSRDRSCDEPAPILGGEDCDGDGYELSADTCYGEDCCPGIKTINFSCIFLY